MIMDDEYDMCSSSASEYANDQADSDVRDLRSMIVLYASPLLLRFVR